MHTFITQAQFECIAKLLPSVKSKKPRKYSYYVLFNALLYVAKTGCQWRSVPSEYPPWRSVYWFWSKLQTNNSLTKITKSIQSKLHNRDTTIHDKHILVIDSQSVDATEYLFKKYKGYDGNKLRHGLKRFVICDTKGSILDVFCGKGNEGEKTVLSKYLYSNKTIPWNRTTLIADKGFESRKMQFNLFSKLRLAYCPMIRRKRYKVTKYTKDIIEEEELRRQNKNNWIKKLRYVVELVFSWFNKYRRLVRCYERSQTTHTNFCRLAAIHLGVRRLCGQEETEGNN